MTFPSGLKRICDICFYLTFASLIGALLGADNLTSTLPVFASIAFLSAFLAPRGWIRYASFILLPALFLFVSPTIANLIILTPAIVYIIWACPKPGERVADFDYTTTFLVFLGIFGFIFAFFMILHSWAEVGDDFPPDTFLFAMMFAVLSIVFMRMARHHESVLRQLRFKVMNTTSLVGVMIVAVLVSNDRFLAFVWSIIRFIWLQIFVPLLEIIAWVFVVIVAFIAGLFGLDEFGEFDSPPPPQMGFSDMPEEGFYDRDAWAYGHIVLIFIVVVVALLILYAMFKLLSRKINATVIKDDGIEEERFALDDDGKEKKRRFRRQKENQVREIYREFLKLVKKKDVIIPPHLTSYEVENRVATKFQTEKSNELRNEYIKVRYGEADFTKEDEKRIKGLYKEIKKEIEQFS